MIASLAVDVPYWGQSLLRVLGGLVAVLLPAGTIVYLFLFKMMSFMQSRLGPMEAGPYGSMQLLAEVGKWLQKEDLAPENADVRIFKMAPLVVLVSTFLLVVIVPFGPDAYFTNFETGIFFGLAVSSVSVLGILIAGWRAPTSTRCSVACAPPASSSRTNCRWCSPHSAWSSRPAR